MRIVYLQYSDPRCYPPLLHSASIFSNLGYQVLLLGWSDASRKGSSIGSFNSPENKNTAMKLLRRIHMKRTDLISLPLFFFWVTIEIMHFKPRIIYVSDAKICLIAYFLAWIFKVKIIFHEHDMFVDKKSFYGRITEWTRNQIISKALIVVYPNEFQKKREQKKFQKKGAAFFCVNNCAELKEIKSIDVTNKKKDVLRIYYHGGLSPALVPESFFFALAKTPRNVQFVMVVYEFESMLTYKGKLEKLARELDISDRVFVKGPMSRLEALDECSQCHVGLVLQPSRRKYPALQYMLGASNKQFDYLSCGLPLLVSNLKNWRDAYVKTGMALACFPGDPSSIADAIIWYLEHPDEYLNMTIRVRKKCFEKWNYENQFQPVVDELTKICI